jgi:hypothetical protein
VPDSEQVYIVMVGQRVGDDWIESLAFNEAWTDRAPAEAMREQMHRTSVFTALETSVKTLRLRRA